MTQYIFRVPDIGEGLAETEITAWHVQAGTHVEEGEKLADIMTDKANVEISSPVSGLVISLHGEIGQKVQVGAPLVTFDRDGEAAADAPVRTVAPPVPPTRPAAAPPASDAVLAAPATRARARQQGVNLAQIRGTGPDGRIMPQDVDDFATRRDSAPQLLDGVTDIKIIGLRRRIAERMEEAKRRIPHFSYVEEFDMTALEALRQELNDKRTAEQPKLTLLPFLIRALVQLVPEFPQVNAWFDDDAGILRIHDSVHAGIATQTPAGLLVPVVHHAETLDLWACAREISRVTRAAREGSITREKLTGSTITLSSLGALGGLAATPIINRPEVAILAPNKLAARPVVRNGVVVIRTMMNMSSSFDHRITGGFEAASFIQGLKNLIENPTDSGFYL